MSLVAICPQCEARYTLQPDMLGRKMRCPNADCRETFTVVDSYDREPDPTATFPAMLALTAGQVEDLVPILEVEADAPPARPVRAKAARAEPELLDAVLLDDDGPKEVAWTAAKRPPRPEPVEAEIVPDAHTEILARSRKRRRANIPVYILGGLIGLIVFVGGAIGVKKYRDELRKESLLAEAAEEEYRKTNFPAATKLYDQLLAEYPDSEERAKYEFKNAICLLHAEVVATGRDNPLGGIAKFHEFVKERGDDDFAKADTGFGLDVYDAGRKLADNALEHAKDKLKRFQGKRDKIDDLSAAEQVVAEAKPLLPVADRFRPKEVPELTQGKALDELTVTFERERYRLQVLAPYRTIATDPSDEKIAGFLAALRRSGFEGDDEAKRILEAAKLNLRKLIATVIEDKPAVAAPKDAAPALLFLAPPASEKPPPIVPLPADYVPETFLACARGILYALDADTGTLLWATRAGNQSRGGDDIPVRVTLSESGAELALIVSDVGGQAGLTARIVRTGEAVWHQPLEAAAAGRPVVVGKRVYVPLRDEFGTVVEFEYATGQRTARITFRQRLGGGAVNQPGTSLLYVPGEGRRIFVLDVHPMDADGNREPMLCVHVLNTDHPDQSLRVPPVVSGPSGDASRPRYLVLLQTDGTQGSKLRAFPLAPPGKPKKGDPPPETAPPVAGVVPMAGHVTLPPMADGERIVLLTDSGSFALLGTNQQGNQDPGLFALPVAPLPSDAKRPVPSEVIHADEDEFWVMSRGQLYQLRLGLVPATGLQVTPVGPPRPGGVPLHRTQINLKRDAVLMVLRSDESDGVRAVAMDPRDGRIRWQRKLGAVPPGVPLPQPDGGVLLVDEDGGTYALPPEAATLADVNAKAIKPEWVLARPSDTTLGTPRFASEAGGVWVLVPERADAAKQLRVRHITGGKLAVEAVVALPEKLAGEPVAVGGTVAVPLADGFLYRFDAAGNKLAVGPQWRGDGAGADAICYLTPAGGDDFLGSDGHRKINRWRWPAGPGSEWRIVGGPWEVRDKLAFAPAVIPTSDTAKRMVVADVAGNVWLFDPDRTGDALRRWRGNDIPAGRPFGGFTVATVAGKPCVVYATAGNAIVCLGLGDEKPLWTVPAKAGTEELLGLSAGGTALYATDVAGTVTAYTLADGKKVGSVQSKLSDLFPRTRAVLFGAGQLLICGWDGSVTFLPVPGK